MSGHRHGYRDVETLRDPEGGVAVISERVSTGKLAVAFFKEFDRDGTVERTAFFQRRHLGAVRRLVTLAEEYLDRVEDEGRAAVRDPGGRR